MDEPVSGLRARKKEATRASLATIARRLFREQGYAETSVEQICRAAQVSVPTFFRYFPTKADVVFHDAEAIVGEWARALRDGRPGETLIEALRRATHRVAFASPERGSMAELRARLAPADPELRRKALELDARFLGDIAGLVGDLLGLDARNDVRPFLLATCAMGAVRSAQYVVGQERPRAGALRARIDEAFDALGGLGDTLAAPMPVTTGTVPRAPAGGTGRRARTVRR